MFSDFEAFLLSKMRAEHRVHQILQRAGLTHDEFKMKARQAAKRWGLDQSLHSAAVYSEAIGDPLHERVLTEEETGPEYTGSVQRLYRLRCWSKVLFRVNQHPSGYAWGVAFTQDHPATQWIDLRNVIPWEWTAEPIESQASRVDALEWWDDLRDVRCVFLAGGIESIFVAKFDLNLLQEWTAETTRPVQKL